MFNPIVPRDPFTWPQKPDISISTTVAAPCYTLRGYAYNKNTQEDLAMITDEHNNFLVRVGDTFANGVHVDRITPDNVQLSKADQKLSVSFSKK